MLKKKTCVTMTLGVCAQDILTILGPIGRGYAIITQKGDENLDFETSYHNFCISTPRLKLGMTTVCVSQLLTG